MNNEKIAKLYKKYNLDKDDIFELKFGSKKKYVICRTGIEKIQALLGIQVSYKIEKISDDLIKEIDDLISHSKFKMYERDFLIKQ